MIIIMIVVGKGESKKPVAITTGWIQKNGIWVKLT